MSERQVSVRLVAVGGQQLKAELGDIGREGQGALGGIAAYGRALDEPRARRYPLFAVSSERC